MAVGIGNDIVIGRRIGVRLTGGGAAGSSLDADAATLIAAMTTAPDATRQGLIDDLIVGLKADGVWALLDELWVTAAHAEQAGLLGWKRAKDLTAVNAPTFEADRGFTGNGTTSYLNTNFVPSSDGVQYTLNDASFGVYSRTNNADTGVDMGVYGTSNVAKTIVQASASGVLRAHIHIDGVLFTEAANADTRGLLVARRPANAVQQTWKNGELHSANTTAADQLPAFALLVGARNIAGTAGAFTTRQYAAAFVGASMSEAQQLALFTRLETFLDAIGAGVVA